MILIECDIEREGIANMTRSAWNKIIREAYRKVGEYWQKRMLPNHFTEGGGKLYGYAPRKKSYRNRKYREKHHRKPLVWSGESEARAKSGRVISRRNGCSVTIPAPALNYRNPKSQVDMRREVTTVVVPEIVKLMEVMERSVMSQVRQYRPKRKRKVR